MKEQQPSFVFLIVIYNCKIQDAETFRAVQQLSAPIKENITLIIWDNGHASFNSDLGKETYELPFEYINTPENISLAKIYNTVKNKWLISRDYLLLFDQDSSLNDDYFNKLFQDITRYPSNELFIPYVQHEKYIISPGSKHIIKGKYATKLTIGLNASKNKLAITSGMCIRLDYFERTGFSFNESLKIYGIDTDFMIQYSRNADSFVVIDYNLHHDLSQFGNPSKDKLIQRFKQEKEVGQLVFAQQSFLHSMVNSIYWWYKNLAFALQQKTLKHLF